MVPVPVRLAGAGVGGVLAAEEGGVPQTAVVGGHVDLGPHAAALPDLRPRLHLCPHLHVLLHRWTTGTEHMTFTMDRKKCIRISNRCLYNACLCVMLKAQVNDKHMAIRAARARPALLAV